MNQFFSFNRFSLLVSKHGADNKKRYILSILSYIGMLIAWFVLSIVIADDDFMTEGFQGISFYLSFFIVGTIYASQYFSHLGSRPKATSFIMVPASGLEKLMCSLLYTVLLFFIVFTAAFYLVDILMVTIANNFTITETQPQKIAILNVFEMNIFHFSDGTSVNSILFFFSVQSIFLLGSVTFKKYSFLKTVICIFIAWFILFWLTYLLYHLPQTDTDQTKEFPDWIAQTIRIVAMYVIAPLLWIMTYYRLKAKQV